MICFQFERKKSNQPKIGPNLRFCIYGLGFESRRTNYFESFKFESPAKKSVEVFFAQSKLFPSIVTMKWMEAISESIFWHFEGRRHLWMFLRHFSNLWRDRERKKSPKIWFDPIFEVEMEVAVGEVWSKTNQILRIIEGQFSSRDISGESGRREKNIKNFKNLRRFFVWGKILGLAAKEKQQFRLEIKSNRTVVQLNL